MSRQYPVTLIVPVIHDKLDQLYNHLENVKYDLESGKHQLFERTKNIHYLRWLIIDDKESGKDHTIFFKEDDNHQPKLIFSSNVDGSIKNHLKELSDDKESELIDRIYSCCKGYPEEGMRNNISRNNYFKKHLVKTSAFYQGSPRRTLIQILNEKKLRNYLKRKLDSRDWESMSPKEIHRFLKRKVMKKKKFQWLKTPFYMPVINWFNMFWFAIITLALLPLIIIWVLIVQFFYERKDEHFTKTRSDLDPDRIKVLEEYEDLGTKKKDRAGGTVKDLPPVYYQNQFSQLVEMKPGFVRLLTFKAMMLLARILISNIFVKGKLMGIPTIHFARWVLFDDNKRVLFFSNFDGSWQQYLGDFIDESGWGLTGIFSNTKVFPKSRFLGFTGFGGMAKKKFIINSKYLFPGGAYDEEHFLAWSRNSELSTQIWYSAYPELSIKNVNNNSRLRVLFSKNLSEKGARKFFELI